MMDVPELTGWVTPKSPQDGGRRRPIFSGYRAMAHLPPGSAGDLVPAVEIVKTDCALDLGDAEQVAPGDTAYARIVPLHPEFWVRLTPGEVVDIAEGSRVVGSIRIERPIDRLEVERWLRYLEERDRPADLSARIARIQEATAEYVRPRDIGEP